MAIRITSASYIRNGLLDVFEGFALLIVIQLFRAQNLLFEWSKRRKAL